MILSDDLINELRQYAQGKALTESLTIALGEWLDLKKIKELIAQAHDTPLEFSRDFTAEHVRSINRR